VKCRRIFGVSAAFVGLESGAKGVGLRSSLETRSRKAQDFCNPQTTALYHSTLSGKAPTSILDSAGGLRGRCHRFHIKYFSAKVLCLAMCFLVGVFYRGYGNSNLPEVYKVSRWSDVDKTHTGANENGEFLGIDEKETYRCWQASFANALYSLGLVDDARQLYLNNFSIWDNERKPATDTVALYNGYLHENYPDYVARLYTGSSVTPTFARQELYRGQAVLLGVSLDTHMITFQGWERDYSILSDSDADYGGVDRTWFADISTSEWWKLSWGGGERGASLAVSLPFAVFQNRRRHLRCSAPALLRFVHCVLGLTEASYTDSGRRTDWNVSPPLGERATFNSQRSTGGNERAYGWLIIRESVRYSSRNLCFVSNLSGCRVGGLVDWSLSLKCGELLMAMTMQCGSML